MWKKKRNNLNGKNFGKTKGRKKKAIYVQNGV